MRLLEEHIIKVGSYKNIDGEEIRYKDTTRDMFLRLSGFVRRGDFVRSKTCKFITEYYDLTQNELPEYWGYVYPNEQKKAESTFRSQCQNVNKILASMLPSNLVGIFTSEDEEGLKELQRILDVLDYNDVHMEEKFGTSLNEEMVKLPRTYAKFEVQSCIRELKLLHDFSVESLQKRISECDMQKLSFLYGVMRKPNFVKSEPNFDKIEALKVYTGFDSASGINTNKEVLSQSDNSVIENGILSAIKDYVGDAVSDEDTIANPDIIMAIASATSVHLVNTLKSYPKSEVAYILEKFLSNDELVVSLYRNCLKSEGTDLIGDYKFLPKVVGKIESITKGVTESEKASPIVAQVLHDYMQDTLLERLESLEPSALARGYKDLSTDGVTAKLIDKFSSIDISEEEKERVSLKKSLLDKDAN